MSLKFYQKFFPVSSNFFTGIFFDMDFDDPIEEDNDPLEELSIQTKDMIRKINQRMRCLEQEWKELKKLKEQHANYLYNLQNSILSRSFVQKNCNTIVQRLINEIPDKYRKITAQEEEIIPTQQCHDQRTSPTI